MFKSFITLWMLVASISALAQHQLAGRVTEKNSGDVLVGATVKLDENTSATITDSSGKFNFSNVTGGKHTLSVSFIGYESSKVQIFVPVNDEINIPLLRASIFTDEVVVNATRASEKTPTTFSTIEKEELQQQNFGQDVPFLLNWTPSVVTTSDAGTGVGYTGIRIRGSDGTRINVTINGIPYNDAESLGTYWVDIPDIASSSQSIQIQRGVGTSTNGASAFGASINLQTNVKNDTPYAEAINSFGSFGTRRHTFSLGTGLLNQHWIVEGRVSKIESDGFIDRATSDLKSYYFSAGYYSGKSLLKAITFGGRERTYQAWYGVPESRLKNDVEAMQLTALNEGWNEAQTQNLLNSNSRTFNPYLYENQVDNYQQDNFQLHFSQQLTSSLTWSTALHYTPGKGYYEEFRINDDFEDYGLEGVTIGDSVVSSADLVRRRWLDNDFYGLTWSLNVDKNAWNIVWGGGANRYDGDHFGEIIWAQVSTVPTEYQYYLNNGDKRDFNSYLKANYQVGHPLNIFADLQWRKITYQASGIENKQNAFDVNGDFNFFNPKFGFTYLFTDRNQLYASFAVAHREPLRNDFLDFPGNTPDAEVLHNVEIGVKNSGKNHILHANYYLMNYKNQFVLTGQVNDVGAFIRTNAGESYRMGIELDGSFKISKHLSWAGNVTLSQNRIKSFTEVLEDYGDNFDEYNIVKNVYEDTPISFSPDVIGGSQLMYLPFPDAEIALLTKYVGKQYLDNTGSENRMIDAYLVNDLRFSYTWKPSFAKAIVLGVLLNNILDEEYESNGYTWGYKYGSNDYRANYYYPQAGRNFMVMLSVRL